MVEVVLALVLNLTFTFPDGTPLTKDIFLKDSETAISYVQGLNRLSIEDGRLKVTYPRGKIVHESGAEVRFDLPPSSGRTLEYALQFAPGFDFSKGGKLPGLAGGRANTGGKKSTGDGWSARLMWRENGALKLYLYHMDMPKNTGQYYDLNFKAKAGQWFTIRQTVRIAPTSGGGQIIIWINGEGHLYLKDLNLMTPDKSPRVDRFLFYTFFGGSTADWAPSIDSAAYFDNIKIW